MRCVRAGGQFSSLSTARFAMSVELLTKIPFCVTAWNLSSSLGLMKLSAFRRLLIYRRDGGKLAMYLLLWLRAKCVMVKMLKSYRGQPAHRLRCPPAWASLYCHRGWHQAQKRCLMKLLAERESRTEEKVSSGWEMGWLMPFSAVLWLVPIFVYCILTVTSQQFSWNWCAQIFKSQPLGTAH